MWEICSRVSDLEVLTEAQQSYWLYQNISPLSTRLKENACMCVCVCVCVCVGGWVHVLKSVCSFAGLLFIPMLIIY